MTRDAPPSSPLHWQAQEALGAVQDVVHLRRRRLQHMGGKPHAMTPCLFRGVFLAGGNMAATGTCVLSNERSSSSHVPALPSMAGQTLKP